MKPEMRQNLKMIQSGEIDASSVEARKLMTEAFAADPQKAVELLKGVDKSLQARSMKEAGHCMDTVGKALHQGDPFGLRAYFMKEDELSATAGTPGHDKNGYPMGPENKADDAETDPHAFSPENDLNRGPRPRR